MLLKMNIAILAKFTDNKHGDKCFKVTAPAKSNRTNGQGIRGICFLPTDNWLKSLKYSIPRRP